MQTVTCDLLNTRLALPDGAPRIVSLVSAATETLYALGHGATIVGVSRYCGRYVPGLDLPVVGDYLTANVEQIRGLDPDIILVTGGVQLNLGRQLAAADLPVYALPLPSSRHGIWENTLTLGALVGDLPAARTLVAQQAARCHRLADAAPRQRPRICAEMWFGKFGRIAGGRTFVHDLIWLAGGENVFGDDPGSYLPLDPAAIHARQPDFLLLFSELEHPVAPAQLLAERGWKLPVIESTVVRGRNIIHDGPSFFDTATWLAKHIA